MYVCMRLYARVHITIFQGRENYGSAVNTKFALGFVAAVTYIHMQFIHAWNENI